MISSNRITPDQIVQLPPGHVFVFGSNTAGRHGKGAAKTALTWGAVWGQGSGLMGRTYGIPTKPHNLTQRLSIDQIRPYIAEFIQCARNNPDLTFLVTEIGCGLAGYRPKDIAPLFAEARDVHNIHLPLRFWRHIY
jgi:hypothetical protein